MGTIAVVMQQGTMTSAAQWLVIGLSVAMLAAVWVVSGERQMSAARARIAVGLVVALALATLAATPSWATVIIPCSDWGCWFDVIFW